MATLNTLVDLLKSKAKKTTEDDDLLEFEKGKYFFGIVKNENKIISCCRRNHELGCLG